MTTFKLAKKSALSDTRSSIYDLHEKKLEYFESEKKRLPEYKSLILKLREQYKISDLEERFDISRKISNLEELINSVNDDRDLNEYLLDFFQTIKDTEENFEQRKNKGQMDSFCTSTVDNSKTETYNNYIQRFNPGLKEVCLDTGNNDHCKFCGLMSNQIYEYKSSSNVCQDCGVTESIMLFDENFQVYTENVEQVIVFNYERRNHFQECLNQLQAKENTTIPPHIIKDLSVEFKKYNITRPEQFTNSLVQSYLKKLKYNKYYEHIPTIINEFCGLKAPKLTPELEQQLKIMFDEIQAPFEKYSKIVCPLRKNFLNYNYTFFKMCQLLGKDEFLNYFPLLKNRERLYEHDLIWKGICTDLQWEYIPSI
jgi:hypothetical protein